MDRRELLVGMGAAAMAMAMPLEANAAGDDETVYELRVYHLNEGKLPLILERFRSKETKIFERLGMHGVAYWTPVEGDIPANTLVYMLRHKSLAAAKQSWAAFRSDPEWIALKNESEKDGAFVSKHESTFLKLTDFSPKA